MELIDVLDEKGNKTGIAKPYDEVHEKGLWHEGVHVWFINSKNEILLQFRVANKKTYPNMWDISAAGHISAGESPETSACREIKEEIGIDVSMEELKKIGRVVQQGVFDAGKYINNEYDSIFLVVKDLEINQFKLADDEVKKLKWLPISEFKKWVTEKNPDLVPHPNQYAILLKALENL